MRGLSPQVTWKWYHWEDYTLDLRTGRGRGCLGEEKSKSLLPEPQACIPEKGCSEVLELGCLVISPPQAEWVCSSQVLRWTQRQQD